MYHPHVTMMLRGGKARREEKGGWGGAMRKGVRIKYKGILSEAYTQTNVKPNKIVYSTFVTQADRS
jgi:hypothetical protein